MLKHKLNELRGVSAIIDDMKNLAGKPKKSSRSRKVLVIAVVVMVAGGLLWYAVARVRHNDAVNQERTEFAQAEKELDNMSAAIVAEFGKPEQEVKSKNCGYTSNPNEFEKGDLYCSIEADIVYPTETYSNAGALAQRISVSISGGSLEIAPEKDSSDGLTPTQLGSNDILKRYSKLSCVASYMYYLPKDTDLYKYPPLEKSTTAGLLVDLDCGARPAKAQYFPLTY